MSDAKIYSCKLCNNKSSTRGQLALHMSRAHQLDLECECRLCKNMFGSYATYKSHSRNCETNSIVKRLTTEFIKQHHIQTDLDDRTLTIVKRAVQVARKELEKKDEASIGLYGIWNDENGLYSMNIVINRKYVAETLVNDTPETATESNVNDITTETTSQAPRTMLELAGLLLDAASQIERNSNNENN